MTQNSNGDNQEKERSALALAVSIGFAIAAPLTFFVIGGVWLDSTLNTRPIFILIGILLGLGSSGYYMWRLISPSNK